MKNSGKQLDYIRYSTYRRQSKAKKKRKIFSRIDRFVEVSCSCKKITDKNVNCKEITDKNAIQKLHNKTTCNYVAIKHNCNEDSFLKRVILLVKHAVLGLEHFFPFMR